MDENFHYIQSNPHSTGDLRIKRRESKKTKNKLTCDSTPEKEKKSKRKYLKSGNSKSDGYFWAQYGVKTLSNSNQRVYYRCQSKKTGCKAKKKMDYVHGLGSNIEYSGSHNHDRPVVPHRHVIVYDLKSNTVVQETEEPRAPLTEQLSRPHDSSALILEQKIASAVNETSIQTKDLVRKPQNSGTVEMASPLSVFDVLFEANNEASSCSKLDRWPSDTFYNLGALVDQSWLESRFL